MEKNEKKATSPTMQYIGGDNLEKIILPGGKTISFRDVTLADVEKHPTLKQYFEVK